MKKDTNMRKWITCLLVAVGVATGAVAATPNSAKVFGTSIADAVEKVMPSVVVIRTEAIKEYYVRDWGYRYWRIPEKLAGQGSGVVISKDGFILTNNHVVDEAENIEVVFNDGTKYPAKVIGADPHTDLAVLKIQNPGGKTFKSVQVGDSDTLRVGEFVIAVGSPLSVHLASSVTLGVVSAKGRSLGMLPYEDFIQTDAAINLGNSGGPLLDADGHMVGVNAVIQTAGGEGNIGIGFAIPGNLAMTVAQSLIKNGKWQRPWIGVAMDEINGKVLVGDIVSGSPADKAGLVSGDEIVAIDGVEAHFARDVQRVILQRASGDKVSLKVLHEGKERSVTLVTAPMPAPHRRR